MRKLATLVILFLSVRAMSQVSVGGHIQTFNNSPYATHLDTLGRGGYMVVKDTASRNAIPCLRRKLGMGVYVQNDGKLYILRSDSCTNAWLEFQPSSTIQQQSEQTIILSGGQVSLQLGTTLTFNITKCAYRILGVNYGYSGGQFDIDSSDALPRFDVLALDTAGSLVYIKGTPAVNPQKPQVNSVAQIELTFIYVNSTSSPKPTLIDANLIYDENVGLPSEWDFDLDLTYDNADPDNTLNPYSGSKAVYYSASKEASKFINYSKQYSADTISTFNFYLDATNYDGCQYNAVTGNYDLMILVFLDNGGNTVSSKYIISSDVYALDPLGYQLISVPMSKIVFNNNARLFSGVMLLSYDCGELYTDKWSLTTNSKVINTGVKKDQVGNALADLGIDVSLGTTSGGNTNLISNGQVVAQVTPENKMLLTSNIDETRQVVIESNKPSIGMSRINPPAYVGASSVNYATDYTYGYLKFDKQSVDTTYGMLVNEISNLEHNTLTFAKLPFRQWTLNFNNYSEGVVNIPSGSGYMPLKVNGINADSVGNITLPIPDTTSLSNRINLRVPYTGATSDVDLGANNLSAQSVNITGTNGNGHLHLKHQATDPTATGQSTALFANVNGDLEWKNAGNYYTTLKTQQTADRTYSFQNKSYTLADSSDVAGIDDYATLGQLALGSTIKSVGVGCRNLGSIVGSATMTNSALYLTAVYLPRPATLTGVKYWQSVQGVYTASNENRIGLYTYSGGTLTLVASTTNNGNLWKATVNQLVAEPFSSTYSASAGLYFVGFLWNSSATTTAPAFGTGGNKQNALLSNADFTNGAKMTGLFSSQTTLPSSVTMSSVNSYQPNTGAFLY